jgi:hypothetical protein
MDTILAKRAIPSAEIGFREAARALREQPGGARRHTSATAGTEIRKKPLIHCPGWTMRKRRYAQTLTAQKSAAGHIHKLSPVSGLILAAIVAGGAKLTLIYVKKVTSIQCLPVIARSSNNL